MWVITPQDEDLYNFIPTPGLGNEAEVSHIWAGKQCSASLSVIDKCCGVSVMSQRPSMGSSAKQPIRSLKIIHRYTPGLVSFPDSLLSLGMRLCPKA